MDRKTNLSSRYPLPYPHNPITRPFCQIFIMSDHEYPYPIQKLHQKLHDIKLHDIVECGGGFVGEDEIGFLQ